MLTWDLDDLAPFDGAPLRAEVAAAREALAALAIRWCPEEAARTEDVVEDLRYLGWAVMAVDAEAPGAQWLAGQGEALFARFSALSAARRPAEDALTPAQAELLADLAEHGEGGWRRLYKRLMAEMRIHIEPGAPPVGLSAAFAASMSPDRDRREAAWRGAAAAWRGARLPASAALDALIGWRLAVARHRGFSDPLDRAARTHAAERATLDSLMAALDAARPLLQRGLRVVGRALGVGTLAPWDTLLTAPGAPEGVPIEQALDQLERSFETLSPEMGAFLREARAGRWIDTRTGQRRRPGAFTAPLARFRTPRVFTTWAGNLVSMRILAHELGHGYHYWSLQHLPHAAFRCSPALEELPSTFTELATAEALASQGGGRPHQLQNLLYVVTTLTRLSAAHERELRLYRARSQGGPLLPDALDALSAEVSARWSGDAISPPGAPGAWAAQRHLFLAPYGAIPYVLCLVLALDLQRLQAAVGDTFAARYRALLENLGHLTVESVITEHLGHPSAEALWASALSTLEHQIDQFD
jgi:oligoendopeptidase F